MLFELQTYRLRIVPLDAGNLSFLIEDRHEMEKSLGLEAAELSEADSIGNMLDEKLEDRLERVREDRKNYHWHTIWEIIDKSLNQAVGRLFFEHGPDKNGNALINFHIFEAHQGKDYMSETLWEILRWAFRNSDCKSISVNKSMATDEGADDILLKNGFYSEKNEQGDEFHKIDHETFFRNTPY